MNLDEFRKRKEVEFQKELVEILQKVEELILWMLARERYLIAGQLKAAELILKNVCDDHVNLTNKGRLFYKEESISYPARAVDSTDLAISLCKTPEEAFKACKKIRKKADD